MEIINLTPHTISVVDAEGNIKNIEASGQLARVATSSEVVATVDGVEVRRTVFGAVTGVPAPSAGTLYLVSTIVAQAARRPDVVSPDTGPSALRQAGQVKAVRAFQTF